MHAPTFPHRSTCKQAHTHMLILTWSHQALPRASSVSPTQSDYYGYICDLNMTEIPWLYVYMECHLIYVRGKNTSLQVLKTVLCRIQAIFTCALCQLACCCTDTYLLSGASYSWKVRAGLCIMWCNDSICSLHFFSQYKSLYLYIVLQFQPSKVYGDSKSDTPAIRSHR